MEFIDILISGKLNINSYTADGLGNDITSTTTSTYPSGTIFRDMGKRSVTYNTSNQEVARYIFVQPQIGAATEGVPANYATQKFYVQVWAAATAATAVTVGRVG
jgi:hypothetical protein